MMTRKTEIVVRKDRGKAESNQCFGTRQHKENTMLNFVRIHFTVQSESNAVISVGAGMEDL
jgi:hypothetical protein